MVQQKAAGRSFRQGLMEVVANNHLTRAWNDVITNAAIRPGERLVGGHAAVADDTQVRLARWLLQDLGSNAGKLSLRAEEILGEHVDPAFDFGRLNRSAGRMEQAGLGFEDQVQQITTLLGQGPYRPGLSERGDVDLARTLALRGAVLRPGPSRAYTKPGELMRQYGIGSPLAAYAAAGTALAAAIQAAWLLRENEKSAPVSGGMNDAVG